MYDFICGISRRFSLQEFYKRWMSILSRGFCLLGKVDYYLFASASFSMRVVVVVVMVAFGSFGVRCWVRDAREGNWINLVSYKHRRSRESGFHILNFTSFFFSFHLFSRRFFPHPSEFHFSLLSYTRFATFSFLSFSFCLRSFVGSIFCLLVSHSS